MNQNDFSFKVQEELNSKGIFNYFRAQYISNVCNEITNNHEFIFKNLQPKVKNMKSSAWNTAYNCIFSILQEYKMKETLKTIQDELNSLNISINPTESPLNIDDITNTDRAKKSSEEKIINFYENAKIDLIIKSNTNNLHRNSIMSNGFTGETDIQNSSLGINKKNDNTLEKASNISLGNQPENDQLQNFKDTFQQSESNGEQDETSTNTSKQINDKDDIQEISDQTNQNNQEIENQNEQVIPDNENRSGKSNGKDNTNNTQSRPNNQTSEQNTKNLSTESPLETDKTPDNNTENQETNKISDNSDIVSDIEEINKPDQEKSNGNENVHTGFSDSFSDIDVGDINIDDIQFDVNMNDSD